MPASRLVRATALALVALTALSLTGCQPGSSRKGKKRHKSSSSRYKSDHSWSNRGSSSHKRRTSTTVQDCGSDDLRLTARTVARPAHRFLVTATNTSGRTCELEGYPRIRFDGVQDAPDIVNQNRPVSDLKLRPGRTAYVAVQTAGASESGSGPAVKDVEVAVLADNRLDVLDSPVRVALDRRTAIGESAVGYWWATKSDALKW